MTPRELAIVRDRIARAQLADELHDVAVATAPPLAPEQPVSPDPRYPVRGRTSILECPVHRLIVALNDEGRICSTCPECVREAAA